MLIGVLSDTHDNLPMVHRAVERLRAEGVQRIIHAGDIIAPFSLKALLKVGLPLTCVFGNCDGEKKGVVKLCADIHEPPHQFELEGKKIVLGHDPALLEGQVIEGTDLVICGHTHTPEVRRQGATLWLNPGEAGGLLSGRATLAVVDLAQMSVRIIELGYQEGAQT